MINYILTFHLHSCVWTQHILLSCQLVKEHIMEWGNNATQLVPALIHFGKCSIIMKVQYLYY